VKRWLEVPRLRAASPFDRCLMVGIAVVLMHVWAADAARSQTARRKRIPFNTDWRFTKGDPDGTADKLSYADIKDWVMATGAAGERRWDNSVRSC